MAYTENTYDFAINQASLVEALEEYKNMEGMLLELKDRSTCIHELTANYSGETCTTLECNINYFFNEGNYAYAYEMVCKVCELMESILPEVNVLLARCEGLRDQLGSDEYVEPVVPAAEDVTLWNDVILALDYNQISIIKSLCEDIAEENERLAQKLKTIMLNCENIIEGTNTDLEAVTGAMNKLNRVLNYKDSFVLYERGVRALDDEIALQVKCILDGAASAGAASAGNYLSDDYLYMSEDEIDALFEDLKANSNDADMKAIANKIFMQEPEEWNEGNARYIALVMEYFYENGDMEMFQKCLQEVCCGDCTVNGDINMIDMIMDELDPEVQGELYYTLSRINNIDNIDKISICHNDKEDMQVQVSLYDDSEYILTVYDLGKYEDERLIYDLGMSDEQIEAMKFAVITDADVEIMEKIFEGDYISAFDVPVGELSENTKIALSYFSIYLYELTQNGNTELQNFTNGILYTNEERCWENGYMPEDYLEMFCVRTYVIRESHTALLFSGDLYGEEAEVLSRNINDMYSYWYSLYEIMDIGDVKIAENDNHFYSRGDSYIQLGELEYDGSRLNYKLILYCNCSEDGINQDVNICEEVLQEVTITSKVEWTPSQVSGDYSLNEMHNLETEIDMLLGKHLIATVLDSVSIVLPEQKVGGKLLELTGLNVYEYIKEKRELESSLSEEEKRYMLSWFYSANEYMVNGNVDNFVYISDGIYDYDVIQGIRNWNKSGIGYLLIDDSQCEHMSNMQLEEEYEKVSDDIFQRVLEGPYNYGDLGEEQKNAVLYLIFGEDAVLQPDYNGNYTSVLDIPYGVFCEAVNNIDEVLRKPSCYSNSEKGLNWLWNNKI